MLHREQRGRRARRNADLAVGVLDVGVGGLDRDPERVRDLLGLQPAREQADDLRLAIGQPRRPLDPRRRPARGLEHRRDGVGVEAAGARPFGERLGGLVGRERCAVGARLGHRVIGVGRGEQPRRRRQRGGSRAAVVARAVEPLVVGGRDRRQRAQER